MKTVSRAESIKLKLSGNWNVKNKEKLNNKTPWTRLCYTEQFCLTCGMMGNGVHYSPLRKQKY